ncbi:hypothetical protein OQ257_11055 [Actinobacillus equuli subsp. equuli]|uniref:Uncharacterized protein n=1 Tax=Actinobacillus equuli subsp. equuli TaxID=202947 RepID=A0A9X4G5S5_ACTEU|nr:hypothetical protein [Actinobacillus equuli]MDE8035693.1 hypothetical protein [Actinobacillus equuli subsp. equuli]MDG4947742.1 hypothetical protein [Actinobacillus equuli subsp. haemolyticus]WGE41850.1 hypothetical protein NYR64_08960 [Actinobacillus equuli subsp. haemolyticus]
MAYKENTCNKQHRYDERFNALPDNQGGSGRHLCAGCAYDEGKKDGKIGKQRKIEDLNLLPSQAGTVRHKDVQSAYDLGYKDGITAR